MIPPWSFGTPEAPGWYLSALLNAPYIEPLYWDGSDWRESKEDTEGKGRAVYVPRQRVFCPFPPSPIVFESTKWGNQ